MFEPASHLSSEAQAYLRNPAPPIAPIDWLDADAVGELRRALIEQGAVEVEALEGDWVSRDETWGGVPCVRFAADEGALDRSPVLVHLHGGAYLIGSSRTNGGRNPDCTADGLPVVSIDYRLAPEHPFGCGRRRGRGGAGAA